MDSNPKNGTIDQKPKLKPTDGKSMVNKDEEGPKNELKTEGKDL